MRKTAGHMYGATKSTHPGNKVETTAEETMAGMGAAARSHIGELLEMHEKNMLSSKDIQRRKKLADEAFARRFEEVMRKHNSADYLNAAS